MLSEFIHKIVVSLPLRLMKKRVVCSDRKKNSSVQGNVLIYYKTDPIFSKRLSKAYRHTNNAEILEMVYLLNEKGFNVCIIDRDASLEEIRSVLDREYMLYIANAAGNSAPYHIHIMNEVNACHKIIYAAGPEPTVSNELVAQRHLDFEKRNGWKPIWRRMVKGGNFEERFKGASAIIYFGNKFNESTFSKFKIPLFPITPSTEPNLEKPLPRFEYAEPKNFLYFGGSGLICKGLDLVLEAFDGLHNLNLDVCCEMVEKDFWDYYRPLLARNPQIKIQGFVNVSSQKFRSITDRAGFNIFPGSAEACATSVVTCMRRGVVPLITRETGVDVDGFGFQLDKVSIKEIRATVLKLSQMSKSELKERKQKTLEVSRKYKMEVFLKRLEFALEAVIREDESGVKKI